MNKKNKYGMPLFWGPDSHAASVLGPVGGDEPNPEDGADSPEVDPDLVPADGGEPEAPEEPEAPATPSNFTMDPATLAAALKAAGLGAPAAPAAPEVKKPLTPEERVALQKQLKFFDPKANGFLEKFGNLETQAEAFEMLRDGLTDQFMTMMEAFVGDRQQQLQSQFAPALTFIQQYESQQQLSRFGTAYKELSDPALQPIFETAVGTLLKSGKKFDAEGPMFKAVASEMEKIIKSVNPNFKLSAGSSPAKPNNGIKPAPRGGAAGGGGNNSGGPAKGTPLAVSMLPKIR